MGILMLNGNNYTGGVQQVFGKANGAIASFTDGGDNKPLKTLKVAINPVQSGSEAPSPENVRPISGWDEMDVTRCGKNRIDKTQLIDNRVVNSTGQDISSSTSWCVTPPIKIDSNDSYYLTDGVGTQSMITGCLYDINMTFLRVVTFAGSGPQSGVINTGNDSAFLRVNIYKEKKDTVQLEKGTTATAYEPYNGTTYPITWSEAGEVFGGYVDYERKKVVATHKNVILDGSNDEEWEEFESGKYHVPTVPINDNAMTRDGYYTSTYPFEGDGDTISKQVKIDKRCYMQRTFGRVWIYDSDISSIENLRTALSTTPLQICYPLTTPIEYDLDEPVPTITTLLGNNNLWSNTGDITECVYQRDLNLVINQFDARITALEQALNSSGTRSLSLSKSAIKEETKEEITEEPKEEEQNEDKR